MTKEELRKEAEVCMHNALFWLKLPISKENVEQGGSYILKLLEPREKRIAELETEVKEWKDKADLWCKTANLKDHNIMINKELEKENAELKEKINILDNCDRLGDVITEAYKDQLTKAKEIIKEFVEWATWQGSNCPNFKSIQDKAEQFLKDSEVEK